MIFRAPVSRQEIASFLFNAGCIGVLAVGFLFDKQADVFKLFRQESVAERGHDEFFTT